MADSKDGSGKAVVNLLDADFDDLDFADDFSPATSPQPEVMVTSASLDLADFDLIGEGSTPTTPIEEKEEQTEKADLSQKDDVPDGKLPEATVKKTEEDSKEDFDLTLMGIPETSHLNLDLSKHKRALSKKGSIAGRKRPTRIAIRTKGEDVDSIFMDSTEPRPARARSLSPEPKVVKEDTVTSPSAEPGKPKNLLGGGGVKIPGLLDGLRKSKSFKERGQKHGSELRPLSKVLETNPQDASPKSGDSGTSAPPIRPALWAIPKPEAVLKPIPKPETVSLRPTPKTDKNTENQSRIRRDKDTDVSQKTSQEKTPPSKIGRPALNKPSSSQLNKSPSSEKAPGLSKLPEKVAAKPTAAKRPPPTVARKPVVAPRTKPTESEAAQTVKKDMTGRRVLPPLPQTAEKKKNEVKTSGKDELNSALSKGISKSDKPDMTDSGSSQLPQKSSEKDNRVDFLAEEVKSKKELSIQSPILSEEKKERSASNPEPKEVSEDPFSLISTQQTPTSSNTSQSSSVDTTVTPAKAATSKPDILDPFDDLFDFSLPSKQKSDTPSAKPDNTAAPSKPNNSNTIFSDDDLDIFLGQEKGDSSLIQFADEDQTLTPDIFSTPPKSSPSVPTSKPDSEASAPKTNKEATTTTKQDSPVTLRKPEKVTPTSAQEKTSVDRPARKSSISHVEAPSSSGKDKNTESRDRRGSIRGSAYSAIGFRSPLSSSEGTDNTSSQPTSDSKSITAKKDVDPDRKTAKTEGQTPHSEVKTEKEEETVQSTPKEPNEKASPAIKKSLEQRKVEAEDINKKISNLRKTDNKEMTPVKPTADNKPATGSEDSADKKSPWGVQLRKVERKTPPAQTSKPESSNKEDTASNWKEQMAMKRRSMNIPVQETEKPKVDDKPEWARASVARRKRLIDAGVITNVDVNVDVK